MADFIRKTIVKRENLHAKAIRLSCCPRWASQDCDVVLQSSAARLRTALRSSCSVLYPEFRANRPQRQPSANGNHSFEMATLFRSAAHMEQVASEILSQRSDERVLLLSAESLSGLSAESLDRFITWIGHLACDVQFVAVVRAPGAWAVSRLGQAAASGVRMDQLPDYLHRVSAAARLPVLDNALGDRLIVVDMQELLANQRPVQNMLRLAAPSLMAQTAELPQPDIGAVSMNEGLSFQAWSLMAALNEARPPSGPLRFNRDVVWFKRITGDPLRAPINLSEPLGSHVLAESAALASFGCTRMASRVVIEYDDSTWWNTSGAAVAARGLSDGANLWRLDALLRIVHTAREPDKSRALRVMGKLLGLAEGDGCEPSVERRMLRRIGQKGLLREYTNAVRRIEARPSASAEVSSRTEITNDQSL